MIAYIGKRLLALPLMLLFVTFVTFSLIYFIPGDVSDILIGMSAGDTTELREQLKEQYGLNDPFIVQYGRWLLHAVSGDLGTSLIRGTSVFDEIVQRLGVTIELAVFAIALALLLGIGLALLASRFRDSWLDRTVMLFSALGMSVPNFFIGTLIILSLSLYVPQISLQYASLSEGWFLHLSSLFFPALSLALGIACTFSRYLRNSMEEVLGRQDYIRTAFAKGAGFNRVIFIHAFRNALIPLVTVAGMQFAFLIGGTVVIETIFSLPGVGRLIISSIGLRDYPIVQGGVVLLTLAFILVNLFVDLLYPLLNPRIRLDEGSG